MATHAHSRPLPRWQRALLPAMLGADRAGRGASGGSDLPRSLRDWLVDVVMFVGSVTIGAAALWSENQDHPLSPAWWIVAIVVGLPSLVLLWVRRRRPLAVGVITVLASAVSPLAGGASIAAMFTVGVYCPPRRSLQVFALSLAAAAIYPFVYGRGHRSHYDFMSLIFGVFCFVVAFVFGSFVRVRRELVLSLRERNRALQAQQARRVAEAQRAERNRIAREMHDVLAHRISLLAVHAGALEFNPDASPQDIARAAKIIRESARAAQEELREVIGVLRTDPDDGGAAEEGPIERPQPTLTDLDDLVEQSREAGMEVRLAAALESGPLPPTLGRTVYRIVQEALTNARKHAPGQVVAIVVAGGRSTGLRVSVTNQPAVGQAGAARAAATERNAPDHVGSGTGLIGLEERVALAGGTLTHEPLPAGGFRISATLPWGQEV
jgi:signal transduction histidine kinase